MRRNLKNRINSLHLLSFGLCSFQILLFSSYTGKAQDVSKFTVRKGEHEIFFFQLGTKSDTVSKNAHDVFYFLCSDSLKRQLLIQIENARFSALDNDSLLQLQYLPGLNYEAWYIKINGNTSANQKQELIRWRMESFLNGSTALQRNLVRIRILNKKTEEILIENSFYYKD